MKTKWTQWKQHKRYYTATTLWWLRYFKTQLRNFSRYENAERRKDHRQIENYLYEFIYDIPHSSMLQEGKSPALQKYKNKIVNLQADQLQILLHDYDENYRMDSEELFLNHMLKMQKLRKQERSKRCRTPLATYMRPQQGIIQIFARYFNIKYTPIEVDASAIEEMAKMI